MTNDTIARYRNTMEPCCMSRLIALIDEYRAGHGMPSEASIARQIGVAKQTVNAWRNRGLTELPNAETLRRLAAVLHMSEEDVLYAAGVDTGYIVETVVEVEGKEATSDGTVTQLPRAARKGNPRLPH